MKIKSKILKALRCSLTIISPKLNTEVLYWVKFGRRVNLTNPRTFNEKLLWLKHNKYVSDELVKRCADKYEVRKYIIEHDCSEILNECLFAYDNVDDIMWEDLPNQFAIKLNVGSGCNIIVDDKNKFDEKIVKKLFSKWIRKKYYLEYAEFQYKNVRKKILVEKYLGDENGELPIDYKFFCFDGRVEAIMVCIDRGTDLKLFMLNKDWDILPYTKEAQIYNNIQITKPKLLEKMIEYSEILSTGFPFVRTDLYVVNDKVYFGELTFTPAAALNTKLTTEADIELGRILDIGKDN